MRIGEAFTKVNDEMASELAERSGIDLSTQSLEDLSLSDLMKLGVDDSSLKPLLYDGALKDFISSRAQRRATLMIDEAVEKGVTFQDPDVDFDVLVGDLIGKWHTDVLQVFALGYSFAAPELKDVAKDKDGFVQLCRDVDRDLISIQVARFAEDGLLRDKIEQRIDSAAGLTSQVFSMTGQRFTRFTMRDWLYKVYGTVALNCFLAGYKVRDLLEEELAFEAMMKETD